MVGPTQFGVPHTKDMFGLAVEKRKALFKLNKGFYTHLGNFVKKPNGLKHSFKIETNKMLLLLKALFFFWLIQEDYIVLILPFENDDYGYGFNV